MDAKNGVSVAPINENRSQDISKQEANSIMSKNY